jgi:flagellar FliL protein
MERGRHEDRDDMADKAAKKKDAEGDEAEGCKKGGKRKLVVGAICIALAGGAYMVGSKSAATTAASGPATTTTIALIDGCIKEPEPGVPEHIVDLPEMSINLADGHYLRVAASLGLCADVVLPEGAEFTRTAPAREIIISTLSNKQMSELATVEGLTSAKEALKTAISAAYRGVVYEVYVSQFVMQ